MARPGMDLRRRSHRLFEPILRYAGQLREGANNKERIILQISLPKPARVAGQPEQPLKAASLYPEGRLPHLARMKVEGRADPKEEGRIQLLPVLGHKLLLFRS